MFLPYKQCRMKTRTIIIWILVLIALDQAIKLVIYHWFMEVKFAILSPLFYFEPFFNSKHSYVNTLLIKHFQVEVGFWPHIVVFLFAAFVCLAMYRYFRTVTSHTKLIDTAFIFAAAGVVCALIGNVCWEKGVLDYVYLKPLFIFDLKDVYMNVFVVLFLIYVTKHKEQIHRISGKELFSYGKFWVKQHKDNP